MSNIPMPISELKYVPDALDHAFKSVCCHSPRHPFIYTREFEFGSMLHIITRTCERTGESVAIRYPHKRALIERFRDVPAIFDNLHKYPEMVVVRGQVQGLLVNPVNESRGSAAGLPRRRVMG